MIARDDEVARLDGVQTHWASSDPSETAPTDIERAAEVSSGRGRGSASGSRSALKSDQATANQDSRLRADYHQHPLISRSPGFSPEALRTAMDHP